MANLAEARSSRHGRAGVAGTHIGQNRMDHDDWSRSGLVSLAMRPTSARSSTLGGCDVKSEWMAGVSTTRCRFEPFLRLAPS